MNKLFLSQLILWFAPYRSRGAAFVLLYEALVRISFVPSNNLSKRLVRRCLTFVQKERNTISAFKHQQVKNETMDVSQEQLLETLQHAYDKGKNETVDAKELITEMMSLLNNEKTGA